MLADPATELLRLENEMSTAPDKQNNMENTEVDTNSTGQISSDTSVKSVIAKNIANAGIALASNETVNRFGSANAEYIKGYRGVDNESGQRFAKGLADIAKYKVNANPDEAIKNIKQQAGFSAEVATTSRDNAEAIIQRSKVRHSRSDDLKQYGKNHNVVDRVQILNGEIIEGSQTQMKFVGKRNELFRKITKENGKFSRYRGSKLELPSEQFKGAKKYCHNRATALRKQAELVRQNGKHDVAEKLRREADNYDHLAENVRDSGLTSEEAIAYRMNPKTATALDIARTSHRAGMEGAQYGALIGSCISLLQNGLLAAQGKKDIGAAAKDLTLDTAKAGALGYGTAFVGAAIKGGMQQSACQTVRTLANSSAPTLAVNVCLSLGNSVKRYVTGEISEAQLLAEVGEKGSGMLSAGMMAALGQLAIPIPFVGAAVGGMIGQTLSSLFYKSALDAARGAELSREALIRTRLIQEAARIRIAEEQSKFDAFVQQQIPQLQSATQQLKDSLSTYQSADDISVSINKFAVLLGKQLEFRSRIDFDDFMQSDRSLIL